MLGKFKGNFKGAVATPRPLEKKSSRTLLSSRSLRSPRQDSQATPRDHANSTFGGSVSKPGSHRSEVPAELSRIKFTHTSND
jgi:hypothetical protein